MAAQFHLDDDGQHVIVSHACTAKWARDGVTSARLPTGPTGWQVASTDPLTITPSIFCNPAHGGCGLHGFITEGRWVDA